MPETITSVQHKEMGLCHANSKYSKENQHNTSSGPRNWQRQKPEALSLRGIRTRFVGLAIALLRACGGSHLATQCLGTSVIHHSSATRHPPPCLTAATTEPDDWWVGSELDKARQGNPVNDPDSLLPRRQEDGWLPRDHGKCLINSFHWVLGGGLKAAPPLC
ncbi:hypothetical protein E2C01_045654 [Portunus trituberculatus]|uniref:Uncharacterized protein n=1 Tax=Portunus trituberculatus TaxID=210409 RepID=A0A5B7FVP5_PORTR|nr:hypothetical protein [Portunus trituberculatus]